MIQSKNTSIKSKRNWQLKLVLLKSRDIFNKCWTIGSNGWKLRLGWRKRLHYLEVEVGTKVTQLPKAKTIQSDQQQEQKGKRIKEAAVKSWPFTK